MGGEALRHQHGKVGDSTHRHPPLTTKAGRCPPHRWRDGVAPGLPCVRSRPGRVPPQRPWRGPPAPAETPRAGRTSRRQLLPRRRGDPRRPGAGNVKPTGCGGLRASVATSLLTFGLSSRRGGPSSRHSRIRRCTRGRGGRWTCRLPEPPWRSPRRQRGDARNQARRTRPSAATACTGRSPPACQAIFG